MKSTNSSTLIQDPPDEHEDAPRDLKRIAPYKWAALVMREEFGDDPGGSLRQKVQSMIQSRIELLRSRGVQPKEIDEEIRVYVRERRPDPEELKSNGGKRGVSKYPHAPYVAPDR